MMNKKEMAEVERLKAEVIRLKAWKLTEYVPYDIPIPEWGKGIMNGYLHNAYSVRIEKACTESIYHNFGGWDKTTSQRPHPLYSTPLLALRAMRYEMEQDFLNKLAKVDALIEKEIA